LSKWEVQKYSSDPKNQWKYKDVEKLKLILENLPEEMRGIMFKNKGIQLSNSCRHP
jgi:hypothetical protein